MARYQQTSYSERIGDGREGMIAKTSPCEINTYVVADAAGIGFARAVKQGANEQECTIGVDGAGASPWHATKYLGVTVRDRTRVPDDGEYKKGAAAMILTKGVIWVKVPAAVAVGDDVSAADATGVLSSANGSANQAVIPNARWESAAKAGELAMLRLDTPQIGGA